MNSPGNDTGQPRSGHPALPATTRHFHGHTVKVVTEGTVTATGGGLTIRWRQDGALFNIEGSVRSLRDAQTTWKTGASIAGYEGFTVPLRDDETARLTTLGVTAPSLATSFRDMERSS